MTLRSKMVATISAFCLVLAMLIIGVWAAQSVKVEMGGSLTFNANDVNVRIEGSVEGAEVNPTLSTLVYSAEESPLPGDIETWQNNALTFGRTDESVNDIVITIEITNLSKENAVNIKVKDTIGSSANVTKTVQRDGAKYNLGEPYALSKSTDSESTATFTITFSVTDKTQSVSGVQFGYIIDLSDESYVAPLAKSSNESLGTVSYPSSYQIGEEVTLSANFVGPDAEFLGWAENSVDGDIVADDMDWTFTYDQNTAEVYYGLFQTKGEDGLIYEFSGTEAKITEVESSKKDTMVTLAIPSTIYSTNQEYAVTNIGQNAFSGCGALGDVRFPNTLKVIDQQAFQGSNEGDRMKIVLPKSLTTLGSSAFDRCYDLTVVVSESITPPTLGSDAFRLCQIQKIYVPSESVDIYKQASGWSNYSNYIFSIDRKIEDENFIYHLKDDGTLQVVCFNNVKSTITDNIPLSVNGYQVTSINTEFDYSALRSITLESPVPLILDGNSNFYNIDKIYVPDESVEIYKGNASWSQFANKIYSIDKKEEDENFIYHTKDDGTLEITSFKNKKIQNVNIPLNVNEKSVTSIGKESFYYFVNIVNVTISDSVINIDSSAFHWCKGLSSVTIGNGVTNIANWAFNGCDKLLSVTFENPNGWQVSSNGTSGWTPVEQDLSNSTTAKDCLINTYSTYYWKRV